MLIYLLFTLQFLNGTLLCNCLPSSCFLKYPQSLYRRYYQILDDIQREYLYLICIQGKREFRRLHFQKPNDHKANNKGFHNSIILRLRKKKTHLRYQLFKENNLYAGTNILCKYLLPILFYSYDMYIRWPLRIYIYCTEQKITLYIVLSKYLTNL